MIMGGYPVAASTLLSVPVDLFSIKRRIPNTATLLSAPHPLHQVTKEAYATIGDFL
jgi:hypothetical protein